MESFDEAERQAARKLGIELRRLREHQDLTQGALARKAGHYSRSTIATVETGWGKCSLKLIRGCDDALKAGGALVKLYFELKEAQARGKSARSNRAAQPQRPRLEDHRRLAQLPAPLFEAMGQVRQAISVLKKRSGAHERTIRELAFRDGGIHIGEQLKEFHGVLTGVPSTSRLSKGEADESA